MQPDQDGFYVVNGLRYTGDFYVYEIDFAAANGASSLAAAGGTGTGSFSVQSQQLFLWQQSCYIADTAQATLTDSTRLLALATVLLTDQGSGKNLTNSAVPIPSIFGTAQLPYILPQPRLCQSLSVISAQVVNYANAVAYNIRLSFIGLALYQFNG